MAVKISAIIIAKNEERHIKDCLESVRWVDEIVLVDTGSTDKTREIAKGYGAKIFQTTGGSFNDWRNLGAEKAGGEWLLYVDADERVTPLLRKEIISVISGQLSTISHSAFAIPRRNILLGHEMKYGGWRPDFVLRLIRKKALISWEGVLHEQPKIKSLKAGEGQKVGKLKSSFVHLPQRTVFDMLEKSNHWSDIEAGLLFKNGHPPMKVWRFARPVFGEAFRRLFVQKGILDGVSGIIINLFQAWHKFLIYAKLWELQRKSEE